MRDVLVVDDDSAVRRVLGRALSHAGYRVTSAGSIAQALTACREKDFRAIVCDYALAGEGDRRFYDQLAGTAPALAARVVFFTGWADDSVIGGELRRTGRPVVRKGTDLDDIIEIVRRVAEGAP